MLSALACANLAPAQPRCVQTVMVVMTSLHGTDDFADLFARVGVGTCFQERNRGACDTRAICGEAQHAEGAHGRGSLAATPRRAGAQPQGKQIARVRFHAALLADVRAWLSHHMGVGVDYCFTWTFRSQDKEARRAKKQKAQAKAKLSFAEDEDPGGEDEAAGSSAAAIQPTHAPAAAMNKLAKLGKDPTVPTDFLPDVDRDRQEEELRVQLRREWELRQAVVKNEPLPITYSWWYATVSHLYHTTHMSLSLWHQ